VLDRLRQLVQSLRESSRQAEQRLGVSGAQLFVLEKLAETPSASLNELAARTYTHQSSVSTVVERLVRRRLVSRQLSPDDRRRLELVLTARGRRLAAETTGAAQHRLISAVQRLPARSRHRLATLLREVVLGMNAADQPPPMFFDDDRKKVMDRNV
jgi:DNA-binding MarR family transcriptional regulator